MTTTIKKGTNIRGIPTYNYQPLTTKLPIEDEEDEELQQYENDKNSYYYSDTTDNDEEEILIMQESTNNHNSRPMNTFRINEEDSSRSSWPKQGTRKGLIMALTVAVVLGTIVIGLTIYVNASPASSPSNYLNQLSTSPSNSKRSITLKDILSSKYASKGFNGTWISDDEFQYFSDGGDLVVHSLSAGTSTTVITGIEFYNGLNGRFPIKCTFSADRKYVLVSYESHKVYRYSSYAKYSVYKIETRSFNPLLPNIQNVKHGLLQLAEWSPVGNAIAFIFENNIFYKSSTDSPSVQLSSTGADLVSNGLTDWVYEEEMFNTNLALWFSPDGKHLAYLTFNDTEVTPIQFQVYGEPGSLQFQYPMLESIPYPKAGRKNPYVTAHLVSFPSPGTLNRYKMVGNLRFPGVPIEHYIGAVIWAGDSKGLLVVTLNRHQNDSRHHLCDLDGQCQTILRDLRSNGWVDISVPKSSSDGTKFITLTSQVQGSQLAYHHILLYTNDSIQKSLTTGEFSVDSILGWDESNHRIYFMAPHYDTSTKTLTPSESHLYYVDDSGNNPSAVICMTCEKVNPYNQPCKHNDVEVSPKTTYANIVCGGPGVPTYTIEHLKTGNIVLSFDNAELQKKLENVLLPIEKDYIIPLESGFNIRARVEMPANLNPNKKYPMFVDVYGGPGSQKITDSYSISWGTSLVSSRNVIYVSIDGRGSGRQSDDHKFQVYRRLGTVEIEDQIKGAEWLINNLEFIDANRTAIWGWSYGGYATALVMGTDTKGVFKCGISVAPVVDWMFYDTIYTERYMGLPTLKDNFVAYNSSRVVPYIDNFKNKKYYLIHGNADDNVHYQQSMILSRALEKEDILFNQQSYPDENHSLGGVRKHLFHSLENFLFTQCF